MKKFNKNTMKLEVTEVTLLSEEEVEACGEYIKRYKDKEPWYFYLRTAHDDGTIGLAEEFSESAGVGDPTEPDYEDAWNIEDEDGMLVETVMGTGIRPMLRIESNELAEGVILENGDRITIGKDMFTYISNHILLRDFYLYDEALETYGIFDSFSNEYESSEAREKVDDWFEESIKPFLN